MNRFVDGYVFGEDPPTGPPATANILLNRLGVDFAPLDEQRAAVVKWLTANEPSRKLARGLMVSGVVNATWFAETLMAAHADVLSKRQVEETEAYIADGDGVLAAYDLFRDGIDDGWLTDDERRVALALAMGRAFSMMSDDVEALARLDLR